MQIKKWEQAGFSSKIYPLTSLRFFAALYVVFFHTILPEGWSPILLSKLLALGFVSVSFFFLLSGYILAIVYLREDKLLEKRTFWAARFARVYPLFLLTLALDTPNLLWSRVATTGWKTAILKTAITFLANVFMLQAWIPRLDGIDNPNWSLAVETIFYLSFPLLGVLLWRLRGASIWFSFFVLYLGGQAIIWALTLHLSLNAVKLQPLLHLSTFAIGILLARWQTQNERVTGYCPPSPAVLNTVIALAVAGFLTVIYFFPRLPFANVHDGLLAPIFAAAVWAFSHPQTRLARWLSVSWMVVLGEASFGLYLIHIPLLHLFERLGLRLTVYVYPVYVTLCIGFSIISFYCVESPTRRWLLNRFHSFPHKTNEAASDLVSDLSPEKQVSKDVVVASLSAAS